MRNKIEKPDEQLGFLLMQVSMLKQRLVNSALKELDLTYMQFIILAAILELQIDKKGVTQQNIATERLLDKAMVSNVIKTLINKKLIARISHPDDNRAYILKLTEEGEILAMKAKNIAKNIDEIFFTDVEKEELRTTLKKLLTQKHEYYQKSE